MTLPVIWLPEAYFERMEALAHNQAIRPELGERFTNAVTETIESITKGPLRFAVIDKGRRRAGVRPFPIWDFLHCGRKQDRGNRLLSRQAPSETLGRTLARDAAL